jgi:nitrite reductase/ring-hydroxylating ferredoxin subunit
VAGLLLLCTADARVTRAVEALAGDAALTVHPAGSGEPPTDPAVVVVDLDGPGALDALEALRARWPEALLAGHLGFPDRERWLAAERAGCDVVANRGALATALGRRLAAGGATRGRRYPLVASAEVAGRLGLVRRIDDTPAGPLAVYHVANRLYVCGDRCPHAGATLSEGELAGPVLTCPRHGSQFDVRTGERRRGPADVGLETFPVLEDKGEVYVLLEPPPGE